MNRQTNFFATQVELEQFHSWLAVRFPDMMVVRGCPDPEQPVSVLPLQAAQDLLGKTKAFLIPGSTEYRLTFFPPGSKVTIDSNRSPVLEYVPPAEVGQVIKVGRIYLKYDGYINQKPKEEIAAIFEWVDSHSIPVEPGSIYRIFPIAAKRSAFRGWVGENIRHLNDSN